MSLVALRVPARLDYRELVIHTVAVACRAATTNWAADDGQREKLTNELVSAVGEAFNNAVLHAYGGSAGDVTMAVDFDEQRIVVEIADFGASFAPERVATPDLDALPVSGMGLYIIRSFADHFQYVPGKPNILRLTRLLCR